MNNNKDCRVGQLTSAGEDYGGVEGFGHGGDSGDGEDDAGHQTRPGQDRGQPRHRQTGETILGQSPGSCTRVELSKPSLILTHF